MAINSIIDKTAVVILAAGKGKRMKDPDKPKVLHELAGKPMIGRVLDTVMNVSPAKSIIIIGHKAEMVKEYVKSEDYPDVEFALQEEQLGTGHAVMQAAEILKDFDGYVLVLSGDVPLIRKDTLINFFTRHMERGAEVSVMSTVVDDPAGYGRIIRSDPSTFERIVEEKDAGSAEKMINEINSGIYLVKKDLLFEALEKISNNNKQGEYYLTDIIEILKNEGRRVEAFAAASFEELQGVNSPEDLKNAEDFLKRMSNN
ncbi:MAG: sugar phosphate nucleotidyltransferase [Bacteroidota bacterium]